MHCKSMSQVFKQKTNMIVFPHFVRLGLFRSKRASVATPKREPLTAKRSAVNFPYTHFVAVHEAGFVQVFGRRDVETIRAR